MSKVWTIKEIEERFEEAARTMRRLPPVKVQGYFSAWPTVVHDPRDAYGWEPVRLKLGPPTADAISRMEETLSWLYLLHDTDDRKIVWCRANSLPWKVVCYRFGMARQTAWRRWAYALMVITHRLNGKTGRIKRHKNMQHFSS